MHSELLLKVSDLFLESLDSQVRIDDRVENCMVLDFHHSGGEFQS